VRPLIDLGRVWDTIRGRLPAEFRVHVRRPDDLLVVDLIFDNLKLESGAAPRLVRKDPAKAATIVVELQPQSFGEEAFLAVSNADPKPSDPEQPEVSEHDDYPLKNVASAAEPVPPLPSARIRMAGRSRLAFLMPASESGLAYTLSDVLRAMRTWKMRLDSAAAPEPDRISLGLAGTDTPAFDRGWLSAVTTSPSWTSMTELVSSALAAAGARGIDAAIEAAADRIATRAARGLASANRPDLGPVLTRLLQQEIDAIVARHPRLDREGGRDLVTAAVSIASTGRLAASANRFEFDLSAVGVVPFLPILLAPHEPAPLATALEVPYRLILSPLAPARWLHRDLPFEADGDRTELWHTRLTTASQDFGPDAPAKVRSIWSPDYPLWTPVFTVDDFLHLLEPPPKPFRMTLDPLDRAMLVRLMAGFTDTTAEGTPYKPRASRAAGLQLSALGASIEIEGNWPDQPDGVDLEQWRHLTSLGRDQYVRVVYTGFLVGFGHSASLIKVTERTFESLGGDIRQQRVAVLRQRFFIVPRERVKTYTGKDHEFAGHNFPFTKVEILTRVTPDLVDPADLLCRLQGNGIYDTNVVQRMVFWPMLPAAGGQPARDFRFDVAATDLSGARVTFSVPLLFVSQVANDSKDGPVRQAYNVTATAPRRRADLGSATVCFAPFTPDDKGDPRLPAASMTFAAGNLRPGVHFPFAPNFYPEVDRAEVGIRPVQKLLNQPNAIVPVTYPKVYKQHRFGESDASKNKGQVFLQLVDQVHELQFGEAPNAAKSDGLGALAAPQMAIQGLSRTMGPVSAQPPANPADPAAIEGALANVIGGSFNPVDFFKGAKILGGIDLGSVLALVPSLGGPEVPKLLSRELTDRVEASFTWDTPVTDAVPLLIPNADTGMAPTHLVMNALTSTPFKNPADVQFHASAVMNNFKVNLFGFVIVWFELLKFSSEKGQKPDVSVQLRPGEDAVQFGGPLQFVNDLRSLIPSNGFSDPPAITVTPSGIQAGYSLNLPAVQVGIFALTGVSLGAGFTLPFDSKPAQVRFNFSDRANTFSLTVSLLGGGGFFAIGVSSEGVNEIEAALEFGAAIAIDLGVASGGVEIKAGIYFHWLQTQPGQGSVDLAGYVRLHGELSVLGLISASLTFNLQLAYHKELGQGSMVWGEATLVIEVEVLLFSGSVEVRCRKEFGGAKSDPKFIDLVPDQATWDEYCAAFALEAA
jgi:hypothetical protein